MGCRINNMHLHYFFIHGNFAGAAAGTVPPPSFFCTQYAIHFTLSLLSWWAMVHALVITALNGIPCSRHIVLCCGWYCSLDRTCTWL